MYKGFALPIRKRRLFHVIDEFHIEKKIGDGAFSKVYKAKHKSTEAVYAIKIVDFRTLSFLDQENIEKEIIAHMEMNHKNIVRLYDFFREDNRVYFVLEYCNGGNLFKYLGKNHPLSESFILKIFKQTTDAIDYVHRKNFVNRDIKPENILLDSYNNIKICDFGWTMHKDDYEYSKLKAGTIPYMSPESLRGKPQDYKSDIWSLGILLFELYHNNVPFLGVSCSDAIRKIKTGKVTFSRKGMSENAKDLVKALLKINKEKRLEIKGIYRSAYVGNYKTLKKSTLLNSKRKKLTISVSRYDKPLHGDYDMSITPVKVSKVTEAKGYTNYFNNLASTPSRRKSKRILNSPTLPIKKQEQTKTSRKVTLKPKNPAYAKMKESKRDKFKFRGAKALHEIQNKHARAKIVSRTPKIVRRSHIIISPRTMKDSITSKYSNNDTRSFRSMNENVIVRKNQTYKETVEGDWVIRDYGNYRKRYPKSKSSVSLTPTKRIKLSELPGTSGKVNKRSKTPVISSYGIRTERDKKPKYSYVRKSVYGVSLQKI